MTWKVPDFCSSCETTLAAFVIPYYRIGQHLNEACCHSGESVADAAKACAKVICTLGGFAIGVAGAIPAAIATYGKITKDSEKVIDTSPGARETTISGSAKSSGGFAATVVAFYIPGWMALAGAEFSECLAAGCGKVKDCVKGCFSCCTKPAKPNAAIRSSDGNRTVVEIK